jgi:peptide/nickel transport system substrate-binding protein
MERSIRTSCASAARLIVLAVCLIVGAACQESLSEPTERGAGQAAGETLVIGTTADLESVNPLTAYSTSVNSQVLFRMFLHLAEEEPDFTDHPPTFSPQLARSWEWSDDRLTLTFHLRDDVTWSDGVPVTAEDVRWTWQAQIHPLVAWEAKYFKDSIRDVEVVDPHTVRFHFRQMDPNQLLHANEGFILPKHVWGRLPFSEWRGAGRWFQENLVTNGPFRLESWKPGEEIVLVANETYHEPELPRLDRVVFRIIPDQATMMTQLLAGQVHFAVGISPEDAEKVRQSPVLDLTDFWSIGYIFIAWNSRNPLFEEPEVRRALTYGIDRQGIVDALWGPFAKVGTSPIISSVWAHNDDIEPLPYDQQEARRRLAEAGWSDTDGDGVLDRGGRPFEFELLVHSGNRQRQDAAVMVQEQLRRIGIAARLRLLEFSTFVEVVGEGRYDACVAGMAMSTDLDLRYLLHSDQIDAGLNYAHYSDPEVDRLIDLANSQPRPEDMKTYLDQIQALVHRDQPLTFLWESKRLTAVNKRVKNAQPNLLSPYYRLEEWWIEPAP